MEREREDILESYQAQQMKETGGVGGGGYDQDATYKQVSRYLTPESRLLEKMQTVGERQLAVAALRLTRTALVGLGARRIALYRVIIGRNGVYGEVEDVRLTKTTIGRLVVQLAAVDCQQDT